MANIKITEVLREQIIKEYHEQPISLNALAKKYNVSYPTIVKVLKNEPKYSKAKLYNPLLKEDFFKVIDSEEKAYFLGLLITDGNVFIDEKNIQNNRQASISITLQKQDAYLLEKFLTCLNANTTVASDGRQCNSVAVRSNEMANDLKQYGIIPRKTLYTYLPKIKQDLMPHLIRGILDGDGSICMKQTSRRFVHWIAFSGTHKLMQDIIDYVDDIIGLKIKPKVYDYEGKHLSEFKFQNIEDIYKFGVYIYKNATLYMERKKDLFDLFLSKYDLHYGNTEVSSEIA